MICGLLSVLRMHALICGHVPMLTRPGWKSVCHWNVCWVLDDVGCFMCLISCERYYLRSEVSKNG
jgi:hypothetical protein